MARKWTFLTLFLVFSALARAEAVVVAEWPGESVESVDGPPIPLAIYAPEPPGRYPVVLFSHGAGGNKDTAPAMMRAWAGRGYVVLVPTHRSDLTPRSGPGLLRAIKEFQLRQELGPAMWRERIEELGAVLDALETGEGLPQEVIQRADPSRAGLAGHSFGAYTALLAGGARLFDEDGTAHAFREPRFRSIAVMSGPGRDRFGLTEESFASIDTPMLVFAGSRDPGARREGGPMWRAEPFEFAPKTQPAYLAFLDGANHVTYVGGFPGATGGGGLAAGVRKLRRAVCPPFRRREARRQSIYEYVMVRTGVFWDATLRDDPAAWRVLNSGEDGPEAAPFVAWEAAPADR